MTENDIKRKFSYFQNFSKMRARSNNRAQKNSNDCVKYRKNKRTAPSLMGPDA